MTLAVKGKLTGYQALIQDATGVTDLEHIERIEDTMRHVGSTAPLTGKRASSSCKARARPCRSSLSSDRRFFNQPHVPRGRGVSLFLDI